MGCKCDTYNGYSNRETWALNLHIQNDEQLLMQTIEEAFGGIELTDKRGAEENLKYWIETFFDATWWQDTMGESMPVDVVKMLCDVGSLWRVEWSEVVDRLVELAPAYFSDFEKPVEA